MKNSKKYMWARYLLLFFVLTLLWTWICGLEMATNYCLRFFSNNNHKSVYRSWIIKVWTL